MAKNAANANIILRNIDSRAQELISSPMPAEPLEVLAHVHALLLYQIIRLFDGDIRMRVGAETTMAALQAASFALMQVTVSEESAFEQHGCAPIPAHCADVVALTYAMHVFWEDWWVSFHGHAEKNFRGLVD